MTTEEFKKELAEIRFINRKIYNCNDNIRINTRYDKFGSHQHLIKKWQIEKTSLQYSLEIKLRGKSYSEWCEISLLTTKLNKRLKYLIENTKENNTRLSNLLNF